MGWASGGDIFNNVAQGLIDANASDDIKRSVLLKLAESLTNEDWDTVDESIQEFADDPVVVEVLTKANGRLYVGAGGEIDWNGDLWTLACRDCPRDQKRFWVEDDTAEGHDRLVRLWAEHEREQHGGTGVVEDYLLIIRDAAS